MSRLWILSDLHQEDARARWAGGRAPEHDIVVLAGDVAGSPAEAVAFCERNFEKTVVLIASNHEFYGHAIDSAIAAGRLAARRSRNVVFLEDETAIVEGIRFVGSTLWTDFDLFGERRRREAMASAKRSVGDFEQILQADASDNGMARRFTTRHARERHLRSRSFIDGALRERFDGQTIVVTHHGISAGSIAARHDGDIMGAAFVSDLSDLVASSDARLWVHGHTHGRFEYSLGRTQVICNARGLGNEDFREDLVIDI